MARMKQLAINAISSNQRANATAEAALAANSRLLSDKNRIIKVALDLIQQNTNLLSEISLFRKQMRSLRGVAEIQSTTPSVNATSSSQGDTASSNALYRLMSQHKDLTNRYSLCKSQLHKCFKEVETHLQENTQHMTTLGDLLEAALPQVAASFPKPVSSPFSYSGGSGLLSGEKKMKEKEVEGFGWEERVKRTSKSPTSVIEHERSQQKSDEGRVDVAKSFSCDGYVNRSPGGPAQQQKVYVRGGNKKEGPIELEVFNQGMFKTELCNKWQETGNYPYGDHCQFTHGIQELRAVNRHELTEISNLLEATGVQATTSFPEPVSSPLSYSKGSGLSSGEKKMKEKELERVGGEERVEKTSESPRRVIEHEIERSQQKSNARRVSVPKGFSVCDGYLKVSPGGASHSGGSSSEPKPKSNHSAASKTHSDNAVSGPALQQKVFVQGGEFYNQGTFKTELCNNWQETGKCPYGDRCQFAHGKTELRQVNRHHRYKTETCNYILIGEPCPYGHRCHYRHEPTEEEQLKLLKRLK